MNKGRTLIVTWRGGRTERYEDAKDGFEITMSNPTWKDVFSITFLHNGIDVGTVYFE